MATEMANNTARSKMVHNVKSDTGFPGFLEASATPRPGDLVFFGRWHIALVTEVSPDGAWRAVEATPRVWGIKESGNDYLVKQWGRPSFFGHPRGRG
jgi:hypothetical protein